MSDCDELRPGAAFVASLPEGDPERARYLAHARGCPGCTAALREGEKLMRLLAQSSLPPPSAEALRRAREPVLARLLRGRWPLRAAAVVAGFSIPVALARHLELQGLPMALLALAAAVALAASVGMARAGALIALAASAAFAFAVGGVPGIPAGAARFTLGELECPVLTLIAAALPLAAAAWRFRAHPQPGAMAQAAAAGALAGQAALHLACPLHAEPLHLWVFHVGAVVASALLGFLLEGQLSSARS